MPWREWFSWMWAASPVEPDFGVPPQPVVIEPTPLICPACQQEVAVLRQFEDGARLCLACLEKR